MAKRFEELEKVYNTLLAIDFDFNTLPANNEYRKYAEWKQDPDKRKRDNSPPASGRKSNVGIKAFGLNDTGDADHTLVKIGSRALGQLNALADGSVFNVVTTSIPDSYVPRAGFEPAKAVLGRANGTGTPKSKITGIEYKKTISTSYTIPFGKGAAGDDAFEFGVQNTILTTTSILQDYVVSFKPEKLGRR